MVLHGFYVSNNGHLHKVSDRREIMLNGIQNILINIFNCFTYKNIKTG